MAVMYPIPHINEIADAIGRQWKKPHFAAVPYLSAMKTLQTVNDKYGLDDGKSIVLYFLSNASSYRGDVARLHKAMLKVHANLKLTKQERAALSDNQYSHNIGGTL